MFATVRAMRIAHVITRLLRAGSEENTLATVAGQIEAGHEVAILHGPDVNRDFALRMAPGVRLIEIPSLCRELSPRHDSRAVGEIRRALNGLNADVVHTHQSKAGIVGRIAAGSVRVPLVIHGVHILPFLAETGTKRAVYLVAEKAVARVTHGYVHVSEGMMEACTAHGIGRGAVHRVVHSGFDLARFAQATPPDDWRVVLGLDQDAPRPPIVGMLAALEARKRHLDLVDRLPALLSAVPDAHVVFAGEGGLRAEIEGRVSELGLERRVHLLGYREDPERIVAMSDLCLLCSLREGLPRSVMQYLAGGRPALVLRVDGIERLIDHGRNGLVFEADDWDGLISASAALLHDEARRTKMARAARETDLSSWDVTLMAGRTLDAYQDAAERRIRPDVA